MRIENLVLILVSAVWEAGKCSVGPACGECDRVTLSAIFDLQDLVAGFGNRSQVVSCPVVVTPAFKPAPEANTDSSWQSQVGCAVAGTFVGNLVAWIPKPCLRRRNVTSNRRRRGGGIVEPPAGNERSGLVLGRQRVA